MSVSKYAEQINNLCAKMQRDFENMLKKYESKLIEYDKNITELQKLQESFAEIKNSIEEIQEHCSKQEKEISSTTRNIDEIKNNIIESSDEINKIHKKTIDFNNEIFGYADKTTIPATRSQYLACDDGSIIENNGEYYEIIYENIKGKKDIFCDVIKKIDELLHSEQKIVETHNNDVKNKTTELYKKIEDLLPGATAAGLTAAYEEARQDATSSITFWRWCFSGSLAAILGIIYFLFYHGFISFSGDLNFEKTIVQIIKLFGCEFPCIWLAWTANVKIAQYTRILEEYRHKWAMARTFEGMRKAISQAENISDEHRDIFYYSILAAFSDNPSKIFDKKYEPEGPIATLNKLFDKISLPKTTKKTEE